MLLEAAHVRLQPHPELRRANTSKSTNIIVMDSAYMCSSSCVSVEVRLCIYVAKRETPRFSWNRCVKVEDIRDGKNKVFTFVWLGETPVGSLHGCVGGFGMWLYSSVDPMAGPALAPITTMIYVGCGWRAARRPVQMCVARIWILLHSTADRTAGPTKAWGRAEAF